MTVTNSDQDGAKVFKKKPQVIVYLYCGLGNQIFQYCAAKSLELEGVEVSLRDLRNHHQQDIEDCLEISIPLKKSRLEFASNIFNKIMCQTPSETQGRGLALSRYEKLKPTIKRFWDNKLVGRRLRLMTIPYSARTLQVKSIRKLRLMSDFQNPSWYEAALADVIAEMSLSLRDLREELPSFDAVVHIRRGDFNDRTLSSGYYIKALDLLKESGVNNVLIVGENESDATEYCSVLESRGFVVTLSHRIMAEKDLSVSDAMKDFCLISNAKNVVMANSTFCWWATVLGDFDFAANDERLVIYPKGWASTVDDFDGELKRDNWVAVGSD